MLRTRLALLALCLSAVALGAPPALAAAPLHVAPEALTRAGGARTVGDPGATGRRAVLLGADGARVRGTARLRARATALTLRVRANGCAGGRVHVRIDGRARAA